MDENPETPVNSGEPQQEYPTEQEQPLQPEIVDVAYEEVPPKKNSNGWVIALIVLLVVCCCCILIWIPVTIFGKVFIAILTSLYQTVISILNSIFGGTVQFY